MKQLNFKKGSIKNNNFGITLIALVITIIVLLILAGISISMLSGDNSILQKATEAKTRTERATIIENVQTDILGQQTENKGVNITKEQLATILNTYFETTEPNAIPDEVSSESGHDLELTTNDEKYKINLSEIFKGSFSSGSSVTTIGQAYEDSWIGKQITYTSDNGESNWIILGKDTAGDILITTANPVGSYTSKWGSEHVDEFDTDLRTTCMSYKGKIGNNNIDIKEARSISVEDVNKTVGISEENKTMIFSDGSDYWCAGVEYLNNVKYVARYIGSNTIFKSQILYISAQYQGTTSRTCKVRPVVVLSSTIPYDDIEIGDYWTYSSGYDSGSGY